MKSKKIFYTMGEVSEMFDVKPSLIRHWESLFEELKPKRNSKGNRLFSPTDVETLKVIYHLVRERGMTLDGAKKALRANRVGGVTNSSNVEAEGDVALSQLERDAQIADRLQTLRSELLQLRSLVELPEDRLTTPPIRRRRDKSSDEEVKSGELFAFYEQRLF